MTGIIVFNVAMLILGVVVGSGAVSNLRISEALFWLHGMIGITSPSADKARMFALIWIGSIAVIVDGLLFMLVFLVTHSM